MCFNDPKVLMVFKGKEQAVNESRKICFSHRKLLTTPDAFGKIHLYNFLTFILIVIKV